MAPDLTNPRRPPFSRGSLRETLRRVTAAAQARGALLAIPTQAEWVGAGAVEVLVRVVVNLGRKDAARRSQAGMGEPTVSPRGSMTAAPRNPFLPYEEALYVADVSDTHVAVLNKFNVVEEHLLVITRVFEHQDRLLGPADFEALWRCLAEYPALGFYNGGVLAGASQAHKHLQVVPLPLSGEGPALPFGPLLERAPAAARSVPGLPFRHAFAWLEAQGCPEPWGQAALTAHARYLELLPAVDRTPREGPYGPTCGPYNLLCTREWMMVVPRLEECFEGISLNSLAFAGAFLVRDAGQVERLRQAGPLEALVHAAGPR